MTPPAAMVRSGNARLKTASACRFLSRREPERLNLDPSTSAHESQLFRAARHRESGAALKIGLLRNAPPTHGHIVRRAHDE